MASEEQRIAAVVEPISLQQEMTDSFTRYAMSVIMARAIPDVRDGLKPSQRRILVAMYNEGLTPDRPHAKCAAIVGETMKTYHPHGDAAIYDTLVRMAQDFNIRYPLIDPQGNFGSVDGDPPGAMRYTEARLSPAAMAMLEDLDKDTVDWQPTFDERTNEPQVLPAMLPNLLANGCSGIAVGYATNIPPHNLNEVVEAAIYVLDNPNADVSSIMRRLPGPDFPTGALVLGRKGIFDYMSTGRGSVTMQGRAVVEPLDRNRQAIIITELPYNVSRASLIQQIAKLFQAGSLEGVSDLRDESDRKGMRIVVELRRDANPSVVLNKLYKHTQLRANFAVNMLVLVPVGDTLVPRQCNIRDLINHFLIHRRQVILRRTRFLLRKAEERAHIVEGLLKALDAIDHIIQLIRASANRIEARQGLMSQFHFTERQAEAILAMQLGQLTRLSREELDREMRQLQDAIADYNDILASEERQSQVIKKELRQLARDLGDERRTRIVEDEAQDIAIEDLIAQEDVAITVTRDGYVKRLPVDTYRPQGRGGRGVMALTKKEEDTVKDLFVASTHHHLLCFTNRGTVYRIKAYEVPMATRQARGTPIQNIVPIAEGERVTEIIPVPDFAMGGYLFIVTTRGVSKKVELAEFHTPFRSKGIRAILLDEGDELGWVLWTDGTRDIILVTSAGRANRFDEAEVRPMGRMARGVLTMDLASGECLVAALSVRKGDQRELLVVSRNGLGKRTPLSEYLPKGRRAHGVLTMRVTQRTGPVVGAVVVDPSDEIMCITVQGVLLRCAVQTVRLTNRAAQGVVIVRPGEGDYVSAVAKVVRYATDNTE
jgi:DNA gyrase subunit A